MTIWNKTIQALFMSKDLESIRLACLLVKDRETIYPWIYMVKRGYKALGLPDVYNYTIYKHRQIIVAFLRRKGISIGGSAVSYYTKLKDYKDAHNLE